MNSLIKKEIRLLLPVGLVVLALEIVLPWFGGDHDQVFPITAILFFFGMILLAVDSFGREFSLGTFSSLMAQPIERHRIWRTKITVLLFAAILVFAAYFASCGLHLHLLLAEYHPQWRPIEIEAWNTELISNFQQNIAISVAVMLVALTGGLWTTLLFRQIAAAFWITFLAPAGLLMATLFFLPSSLAAEEHVFTALLYILAGLYVVWGFWLAHRQFHRAQDAGWTGGIIAFSRWRYFESGSKPSDFTRHRKPVIALIKKELQLQSISWFCAAALLVLHLSVIFMRYVHGRFEGDSVAGVTSEFFWTVWLILPLIIGSTAVAEERRLGVTEGQFCQPASRRLQFALKYFPAIFSGVLLGGLMPLLVEGIAAAVGAPNPDLKIFNYTDANFPPAVVIGLALGLSFAAFYASTLSKNFMQAMGIAVMTIIGCCLFTAIAGRLRSFLGISWNPDLTIVISLLTGLVMAPSLSYGNFKYIEEHGRIQRRNFFGLVGAIVFIFISSAALYNRAWEIFESAEPTHDTAKLSLANPPKLEVLIYDNWLVRLPDGRVWFDRIEDFGNNDKYNNWKILTFHAPFQKSVGPEKFIAGSNWVAAITGYVYFGRAGKDDPNYWGYLDTVGIQPDGTLWVSEKPKSNKWTAQKLEQFGNESNWQQLTISRGTVVLLKKNGTLWSWGKWGSSTNNWGQTDWPGLRAFQPQQIGTNSDWQELFSDSFRPLARQANGRVWILDANNLNRVQEIKRNSNFDDVVSTTVSANGYQQIAFVRTNGTLWTLNWSFDKFRNRETKGGFLQVGKENDWRAVAINNDRMVALKSDGSLWQWDFQNESAAEVANISPIRLGIHSDWVAIKETWNGVIALAADGSLWFWPDPNSYGYYRQSTLLKLPKQPQFLGNVLGGAKR